MARLELDDSGGVLLDGEAHVPSDADKAEVCARAPEFFDSLHAMGLLIASVDNAEWQQMMSQQVVRLLDAMHGEIFSGCCPTCQAIVDATFQSARGGMAS
jgi:hypothetical protein